MNDKEVDLVEFSITVYKKTKLAIYTKEIVEKCVGNKDIYKAIEFCNRNDNLLNMYLFRYLDPSLLDVVLSSFDEIV